MRTGSHLKIVPMGTNVLGVRLEGNPQKPEPDHFRIVFPGGDLEVVRCSENADYWVHVRVNHRGSTSWDPESEEARIAAARLDINGKNVNEANIGDFNNPELYHLAVRVRRI